RQQRRGEGRGRERGAGRAVRAVLLLLGEGARAEGLRRGGARRLRRRARPARRGGGRRRSSGPAGRGRAQGSGAMTTPTMRRGAFGLGAFAACAFALVACAGPAQENGRLVGLKNTIEQAKANGALRCAPRELALAETHAEFAQMELDQGFLSRAQ